MDSGGNAKGAFSSEAQLRPRPGVRRNSVPDRLAVPGERSTGLTPRSDLQFSYPVVTLATLTLGSARRQNGFMWLRPGESNTAYRLMKPIRPTGPCQPPKSRCHLEKISGRLRTLACTLHVPNVETHFQISE